MAPPRALADQLLAECRPRAKSLIVTVIGDTLSVHGGVAWLSSFIALGGALGLNERLVRTAVQRLVRDRWLVSEAHGRRSAYRITEAGWRRVAEAGPRIYAEEPPPWDGEWRLLFTGLGALDAPTREKLRRELLWLGFGQIAQGVFARPSARYDEVAPILDNLGVRHQVAPMRGRSLPGVEDANRLFAQAWNLDALAADYRRFLALFGPVDEALNTADPEPETGFVLRMLAIHEFRRVLLRDPGLPEELTPPDWAGIAARELCAGLYRRLVGPSTEYLMDVLERPDGPVPAADDAFYARFGGIDRPFADQRRAG